MTRSQSKRPRPGARGIGLAATLTLAASLAGCAPADTGLPRDTARHLQELVLGVSQSAAANDHAAALRTLDSLEADMRTAAGSGQISEERSQGIMTSISAVKADLTAAFDAAAAKAAEEAAAAAAAEESDKAKAEADAQAAAGTAQEYTAPVVAAPVPAPSPAPEQRNRNESKGKGKNKDS